MNVARAVLNGLIQDQIHETNDRCRICFRCHRSLGISLSQLQRFSGFAELLQHFLHAGRIGAVILLDQLFDLLGRRNNNLNVFAERKTQILRDVQIKGVGERHP